ncbi:MAG: T9SS type A sorting domain-containing protein [bacterium]
MNLLILAIFVSVLPEKSFSQTDNYPNYNVIKDNYESNVKNINPDRKKGNKWFYRWLWDNRYDIKSDGQLKQLPYFMGYDQNQKNNSNRLQAKSAWIPLGPDIVAPTYEPRSGHGIGRVNCVAFHPTNPNILWIGTPGGGVWKSENSGQSWIPQSDFLQTLSISHIAVDPTNANVLYICTGDYDTGGMSSSASMGVFKSIDGGNSWTMTNLISEATFKRSMLRKLIINPSNTNQLITAGTNGIWKSSDAGDTWYSVNDSLISDLEANPKNPDILYAAMGTKWGYYGSAGVLKSTDFGATWVALNTGIPAKNEVSRMDIAVSPINPNYLYVLNVKSQTNGLHSIYASTDAGETWEIMCDVNTSSNILGAYEGSPEDVYGQGSYDLTLIADPYNKLKIYTGGINIWASDDGGKTFDIASLWMNTFGKSIHADHHYSAYNPINQYIYFCNDGGIYRTKSIKPGSKEWIAQYIDKVAENIKPGSPGNLKFPTEWECLSNGLNITEFYRLNVSRKSAGKVTGGSQDNSCFYNDGTGWINYIANWDGMETMIDHNNPERIYGVWQNGGLCRSDDGGKTIITGLVDSIRYQVGDYGSWVTPTAMDPINPENIYMGFRNLWKSTNYGKDWKRILDFTLNNLDTFNFNPISIIKTSYNNSDYIAVYKNIAYPSIPGGLWLSKNGGANWFKSTDNLPIDSMNISSIEFDSNNPNKMWISVYSTSSKLNLFKTEDFGQTWVNASKALPEGVAILSIVRDQNSKNNTIYAGTNKGVLYCFDEFSTINEWLPFMENLPNVEVNELEIQQESGELYAATYGRGIWKTGTISAVKDNKLNESVDIEIYPNPVKNRLNLRISNNPEIQNIVAQISVIDITGRTVFSNNTQLLTSNTEFGYDVNFLPGVYFIQIKGKGLDLVKKFVVKL